MADSVTRITVTLKPIGPGNWSPLLLQYDPRVRSELPAPMEFRRGQIVALLGKDYRVARVTA